MRPMIRRLGQRSGMSPEGASVGSLDLCLFAVVQVILVRIFGSASLDLGAGRFLRAVDTEHIDRVELVAV